MLILRTLFLLLLLGASASQAASLVPPPPAVNAKGYMLMDFHSGQVLAESGADQRMEPASLTKIMTSYVIAQEIALGRLTLDDEVRISEKAWRMPGSRMFVNVNTKVPVRELLMGIIVQSGNDATVALAEHVAGSEEAFAALMNQYGDRLDLKGSHFANSTGMPHPEHYTTPRDLAVLSRALIRDFPEHYALYAAKEYTYNGIKQPNRNLLLWRNKQVDGVKTGHTEAAGFCLVASAEADGMRIISVVLGTKSEEARATESQKLLTYGFRFFETRKLYAANETLTTTRIWKGETEQLPLGLQQDLYVTIPRGHYDKLKAGMNIPMRVIAPVNKGDAVGTVNLRLNDESFVEMPLHALSGVASGGWFGNLVDEVKMMLE